MKKCLLSAVSLLLMACGTTQPSGNVAANNPSDYCRSVGGEVKTVGSGDESFCLLPGGDVVKLKEFYDNNH